LKANLAEVVNDLGEAPRLHKQPQPLSILTVLRRGPCIDRAWTWPPICRVARRPPALRRPTRAARSGSRSSLDESGSNGGPLPRGLGAVSYHVIRQRGAVPDHASDGEIVADLDAMEWIDPSPRLASPSATRSSAAGTTRSLARGPAPVHTLLVGEVFGRPDRGPERRDRPGLDPLPRARPTCGSCANWARPPVGQTMARWSRPSESMAHDLGLTDDRVYHYGLLPGIAVPTVGCGRLAASSSRRCATGRATPVFRPVRSPGARRPRFSCDGRLRLGVRSASSVP